MFELLAEDTEVVVQTVAVTAARVERRPGLNGLLGPVGRVFEGKLGAIGEPAYC